MIDKEGGQDKRGMHSVKIKERKIKKDEKIR